MLQARRAESELHHLIATRSSHLTDNPLGHAERQSRHPSIWRAKRGSTVRDWQARPFLRNPLRLEYARNDKRVGMNRG